MRIHHNAKTTPAARAAQGVVPGQPVAEAVGQTQHPLPHRHSREHAVDQVQDARRGLPRLVGR